MGDFFKGLQVMYTTGVAGKKFYIGDETSNGYLYGLVNIAAFLAQAMKETIKYNACDENSWDLVNGKYPVSNACGQLGQSYQDYTCSAAEAHMECELDSTMALEATTNAKWYGAPAPLYCGPKTTYPTTGYWDYNVICDKPYSNPPSYCTDYEGQKAGGFVDTATANSAGRTDVENCCWWGRGSIQLTGRCNYGKLNYFLGKKASDDGRTAPFPDVNFCKRPDLICSKDSPYPELKWVTGFFYWMESVQSYDVGGWNYLTELKKFVDDGMTGTSFIDSVSGIVNRGCHNPPCQTGALDGGPERATNFNKALEAFGIAPSP